MQAHHMRTRIATARVRSEPDYDELDYLEGIVQQAGDDEFVEDLMFHMHNAENIDGTMDERVTAKALSYAGFSAYARR